MRKYSNECDHKMVKSLKFSVHKLVKYSRHLIDKSIGKRNGNELVLSIQQLFTDIINLELTFTESYIPRVLIELFKK